MLKKYAASKKVFDPFKSERQQSSQLAADHLLKTQTSCKPDSFPNHSDCNNGSTNEQMKAENDSEHKAGAVLSFSTIHEEHVLRTVSRSHLSIISHQEQTEHVHCAASKRDVDLVQTANNKIYFTRLARLQEQCGRVCLEETLDLHHTCSTATHSTPSFFFQKEIYQLRLVSQAHRSLTSCFINKYDSTHPLQNVDNIRNNQTAA